MYLTITTIDYYNEVPYIPGANLSNTNQAVIVIQRVQKHLPVYNIYNNSLLMVLVKLLLRVSKSVRIAEKITSMGCYKTSKTTSVIGL